MSYTVLDDFNRADTDFGGVANGTTDTTNTWKISNNHLYGLGGSVGTNQLLLNKPNLYNVKYRVFVDDDTAGGTATVLSARTQPNGDCFGAYTFKANGEIRFWFRINDSTTTSLGGVGGLAFPPTYCFELEVNNNTATARLYQYDGVTLIGEYSYDIATFTTDMSGLGAGKIGISPYGTNIINAIDYFEPSSVSAIGISGSSTIYEDANATYTISANGTVTSDIVVNISSTGETATITPSTVTLTSANQTANITVKINNPGAATLTATASGLTPATKAITILAAPLSLGLVGDSITEQNNVPAALKALLSAYPYPSIDVLATNRGFGGRTTVSWLPQNQGGEAGLMSGTITAFNNNNVKVVSDMVGTNDSKDNTLTSKATYKANTIIRINYLFANVPTLEKYVLQYPVSPATSFVNSGEWNQTSVARIQEYHAAIDEIAAMPEYADKVFVGSKSGYDRICKHPELLGDGIHPGGGEAAECIAIAWLQGIVNALGLVPGAGSGGDGATIEQITAAVSAALIAAGYTTARAAKLDRLDQAISTVAPAVWNTAINDQNASGLFAIIAGLVGHNARLADVTANANGAITGATIKLFENASEAESNGEAFAEYANQATYTGAVLIEESTIKQ